MKNIGFNLFCMLIQWLCLIEDFEMGKLNDDVVCFYYDYFDEMICNGIELIINFYYFDMLEELQNCYGGFEFCYVVELFGCFVKIVFELFGYKIKYWIIFNELIVLVEGGYLYDFYYLCKKDGKLVVQVVFNIMLVYVKVVKCYCEQ